jgi:hypothetical protein
MPVNINLRVTSFGQVVFEMGKPTPPIEVHPTVPAHEEVRYREPPETASLIYEVEYQEELMNYVVPLSTA